jgi:acyl-coenzyme A synthetase/AMP-(fatty) acid ligase
MSPRNSVAAVINMMQKTKCARLITTHHTLGPLIDGIQADFVSHAAEASQLQIDEFPVLKDLYPALIRGSLNEPFVPYHSPASRPHRDDVLFYLHSSGSTGFPKPIPITNLTAVHWCMSGTSLKRSVQPRKMLRRCNVSMHVRTH